MDNANSIIFSIIIPVTRGSELRRLLSNLAKQTFNLNGIEVIAVFRTQEVELLNYPFNLTILFSDKNHPGIKRNLGCSRARGEYYAFIDDDCLPSPDWLANAFKLLQKYKVVCGPCRLDDGPFTRRISRAIGSSFFGSGNRICCNYKETAVPFYNVGFYNVFMHKHIWELAGGCNEEANFLMDDKEFFYLLSLKEIKLYNSPEIEVSHNARSFPVEYLKQSFRRKVLTGINFFVYNEIFRKQPIFYFIYASYFVVPLLFLISWKILCTLTLAYYALIAIIYHSYLKKDYKIYLCLPIGIMLTNIVMLAGILCGSLYFLFRKASFNGEIITKKKRITRILTYA